jgi:hypothetical protein
VFFSTFKVLGIRVVHRTYKKKGQTRHCYAPVHSFDPVFSPTPLTRDEVEAKLLARRS